MPDLSPSIAALTKRAGFLGGTVKADPSAPDASLEGGPTPAYYDPQYLDRKPPTPASGGGASFGGGPTPAPAGDASFGGGPTPAPGGGASFGGGPTPAPDASFGGGPTSVGAQPFGSTPPRRPRQDFPSFTGLMNRSGTRPQIVY